MLLVVLIYAFGVLLTALSRGSMLEHPDYFGTVLISMNTLMLGSIFPDLGPLIETVRGESYLCWFFLICFFCVSSIALMNLMIGVMAEVVHVVSSVEKEQSDMARVKELLLNLFSHRNDMHTDFKITEEEFRVWIQETSVVKAMKTVGASLTELVDLATFMFAEKDYIQFSDLMEVLWDLRASNSAKVKDIVALRKILMTELFECEDQVLLVIEALKSHGMIIQPQMIENKRVPPLPQFPPQTGEMSDPSSCVASHRAESLGSLYVGDDMDRPLSVAGDPNRPLSLSENSSYQQLASAY